MDPRILIPVDDSPTANATVDSIVEQRERFPSVITLLYVINRDQLAYKMIPDFQLEMVRENAEKAGDAVLKKHAEKLKEAGFSPEVRLEHGTPRHTITDMANDDNFNLVIIGRHEGGGEIRDVLFGSVANYVLHNVKCPVLLF